MRNYFDCRVLYCSLSIEEGWGEVGRGEFVKE